MADIAGIAVCGALVVGAFLFTGYSVHKEYKFNSNKNKRNSEPIDFIPEHELDIASGKKKSKTNKKKFRKTYKKKK